MDTPRFDFNRPQEEQPVRRLPGFEKQNINPDWVYAVLGIALGLLIAVLIQKRKKAKEEQIHVESAWDRVREVARVHKLDDEELLVVIDSLKEIGAESPDHYIVAPGRFAAMLAPEITRRVGEHSCDRIRRKLFFGGAKRNDRSFGGTNELECGQKLRLHFEGVSGAFTCGVLNVGKDSFIIALPASGEHHIKPRVGGRVDGYVEIGNDLYAFESTVDEVFMGGVFACRIAHARDIHRSHHREASRIRIAESITFSRISGLGDKAEQFDFKTLQAESAVHYQGVINDISAGGCSLTTQVKKFFEVGDFFHFAIPLPGLDDPQEIIGQLIHVSPISEHDGGGQDLHLQYVGLDEETQANINHAIHKLKGS